MDKFYATCEEKEIVYDYFHNKLSKYEIAKKTNLTSKTISYKINRSLYLFKINNNIESYRWCKQKTKIFIYYIEYTI